MSRPPVYLDYHATTPVDPRVLEVMLPYFTEVFGNPASSSHQWGWKAQEAVEEARRRVAALIGGTAREITFTSGATESNNFAIKGVAASAPEGRRHMVCSAIEHKSVLEGCKSLEKQGWTCTVVPVGPDGRLDLNALADAVTDATALVSVMAANNEVGVLQPMAEIAAITHAKGALFHTDAAQAVGKVPVDVQAAQVDLLSLTGHKMYGPKGCGALYIRRRTELAPLIIGGGQERGMRSGTLNVPGIVGLGYACLIDKRDMPVESARLTGLRNRLLDGLRTQIGGVTVSGSMEHRLPHNLHVGFEGVDGSSLMIGISDIAVSSGSACSSASATPSHVLLALFGPDHVPSATIRFGLGRHTTDADIDYAIEKFAAVVRRLREAE
ncbi:MAG: cysteine desulfurase [Acidobacteria bacterium]|jgi:cysteine desulfurase|nr:cysteine desulfurase [Acidobacteriota bacterium]